MTKVTDIINQLEVCSYSYNSSYKSTFYGSLCYISLAAVVCGDPHYKLFDGENNENYNFHFQGKHSYVVLRLENTTTNNPVFELHADHVPWPSNSNAATMQTIAFGLLDRRPMAYQVIISFKINAFSNFFYFCK